MDGAGGFDERLGNGNAHRTHMKHMRNIYLPVKGKRAYGENHAVT